MKKLILIGSLLVMAGCQTSYITPEGQRVLGNTAAGCVLGEILFDECGAGAAVGAFTTVITDQK
tara:strand:+ start:769 stop:960 length:192 start_codon:yes stop_codon:yes gene_type:complete